MTSPWQDVRCASIPVGDLAVLADLRRVPGIRVAIVAGRAWVCWDAELHAEASRRILVERLLPVAGAEMFARRDGHWYRPGVHLPAFDVPIGDGSEGVAIGNAILPHPLTASGPDGTGSEPVPLRLVRDERHRPRPAAAERCRLDRLAEWAERAPSTRIESLTGAWVAGPPSDPGAAEVLLLGLAGRLPALEGSSRFWGHDALIPMGFRAEPDLPEPALRHALGARSAELLVLDTDGPELIPRAVFRPLSRAGIRLARAEITPREIPGGPRR